MPSAFSVKDAVESRGVTDATDICWIELDSFDMHGNRVAADEILVDRDDAGAVYIQG